ncbi:MAG: SufE family protein [Pseudomonadales bacterium]
MKHTASDPLQQWLAATVIPDLAEISDTFELFDDWEDRYRYVIELGKGVAHFAAPERSEQNLVRGCQSQVWLQTHVDPATQQLTIAIDSDAHIVRGLAAILIASLSHRSTADIQAEDPEQLFESLGLLGHLSPSRGNGLRAMIARIQGAAAAA